MLNKSLSAEEASSSEEVSILNRIARSSGNGVKKDTKRKKQNKNRRQRNKAKKVSKKKSVRRKRNKAKKTKKAKKEKKAKKAKKKKTNTDKRKRNKAKKTKKTNSKAAKNKSKKEKKRSRKQRKKSKKNNKNGRRNGRKKSTKCARQSGPDDSTCMVNIGTAMDYEGNQVYCQCSVQILLCVNKQNFQIANFLKQKKRIESFSKLMGKKGGKKDDFVNSTSYITSACNSGSR